MSAHFWIGLGLQDALSTTMLLFYLHDITLDFLPVYLALVCSIRIISLRLNQGLGLRSVAFRAVRSRHCLLPLHLATVGLVQNLVVHILKFSQVVLCESFRLFSKLLSNW